MNEHIVKAYDEDLARLKSMIAEMGGITEEQLAKSIDALTRRDLKLADEVIAADEQVDTLERHIEEKAILTIARRQPMARDLREIMVSIRIASDLERIGDLAKNLAKRSHAMPEVMPRKLVAGLSRMGQMSLTQLKFVLDAYASGDEAKALGVWRNDEELDALYNSIFRELLTYMMEDPRMIGLCTHLLFATKNIERIGDHCTNIAENILYMARGKVVREERPKMDNTASAIIGSQD